jgi:hypothetical protein
MKSIGLCMILMLVQGCTHCDPFVSFRPLFVGLDETRLPARARVAVAEAKYDFQRARKGRTPHYAILACSDPVAGFTAYRGKGYKLTIYEGGPRHRVGQKIEIDPSLAGGRPFQYDESYEQWD